MDNKQATAVVTIDVQDIFSWRACYSEQDYLDEQYAVGGFGSVDLARCTSLVLLYQGTAPVYSVQIPVEAEAVFFRRRRVEINPLGDESEFHPTIHCIGWKRDGQEVYLFVHEDGSTLLSSDLQAV